MHAMTGMPSPGCSWVRAAASNLGMWDLMMAAMMLPLLVPMLCRYRRSVRPMSRARLVAQMTLVAAGYLSMWTLVGAAAIASGALWSAAALMQPIAIRAQPYAVAAVVVLAGAYQLSGKKRALLLRCHRNGECLSAGLHAAWSHGIRLGATCISSCANLTVVLVVLGAMDVRVMVVVGSVTFAERRLSSPHRRCRDVERRPEATGFARSVGSSSSVVLDTRARHGACVPRTMLATHERARRDSLARFLTLLTPFTTSGESMRALKSESELDNVLGASCAVLLKHGATCPISAKARDEIADLCRRRPDLTVASVEVKDHRALSDTIAERLGVEHQSPQVFVLRNGAVAWSAEHYEIKADDVERQLAG